MFEQVNDDGRHALAWACGAVDRRDTSVIDASYRATTEYHDRCTACAATQGWCDMSAVI